ncbi:hypothetical protein RDABS01_003799 [Bienertia sinuspersici]
MESSCNKNPKYEEKGLRSLLDTIHVSILSFLPLKVAVTTSVLCQRWRYLWIGVSNVNVDLRSYNQTQPYYSVMSRLTSANSVSQVIQTSLQSESRGNSGDVIVFFAVPPCIQCETLVNLVLKISKGCFFLVLTTVNLQN